jgi:glycosyltransferase involved in cell wall biosynthesis/tetratricopeptide (TPR) repeat protein
MRHIMKPPWDFGKKIFAFLRKSPYREMRACFPRSIDVMNNEPDLSSIIILCCNQLPYTQVCLQSVRAHTRGPYELILVDNGSSDGTATLLDQVARQATLGLNRTFIIRNSSNKGYAAAVNQGLQAAKGSSIVLLNNDTIVTPTWLDRLTLCARHGAGLVGPTSNYVPVPQYVPPGYQRLEDLNAFAAKRGEEFRGQAAHVSRLSGFCLLIQRAVLSHVGLLDERFGLGFFEDDDLCFRAQDAGFKLALALDVYIHHFGSKTIHGLNLNAEKLLQDNFRRFRTKWGQKRTAPYRAPAFMGDAKALAATPQSNGESTSPSDSAPIVTSAPARVSLTMIVKNEEANLGPCLESIHHLVQEMVVVDTGSTDKTKEIATSFGAKVVDFPWVDSFAAARNVALEHATGDYAFWLDADDRVSPDNQEKLRNLFATLRHNELVGYAMKCCCLPDPQSKTSTIVDHVRLFPLRPEIRWSYRVHEQILPAFRGTGGGVRWSDVVIQHTGYVDITLRRRKLERDLRLLEMENQEHPDDPFTLFNLGSVFLELNKPEAALPCLERSLDKSAVTDSIVRKLFALISSAHRALGNHQAALQVCIRGRQYYPMDVELLFREAVLRRQARDLLGAAKCLERLLAEPEEEHFGSVDAELSGSRTRDLLGHVYLEMRQLDKAKEQWDCVLTKDPEDLAAHLGLAEYWLEQQHWPQLEATLQSIQKLTQDEQPVPLLKARALLAQRQFDESRAIICAMIDKYPRVLQWRVLLSHAWLQEGKDFHAAEAALRQILNIDPSHSEARHNLEILLRDHPLLSRDT